jgi:C-terminal processing protease CtpA/Prc
MKFLCKKKAKGFFSGFLALALIAILSFAFLTQISFEETSHADALVFAANEVDKAGLVIYIEAKKIIEEQLQPDSENCPQNYDNPSINGLLNEISTELGITCTATVSGNSTKTINITCKKELEGNNVEIKKQGLYQINCIPGSDEENATITVTYVS